jgi:fermentation-respiration switch protein FrsA (DUF1100 family)
VLAIHLVDRWRWLVAVALVATVVATGVIVLVIRHQRLSSGARLVQPTAGTVVPPSPAGTDPARSFAVGVRHLSFSRAPDRPLPTTIWYPAAGGPEGEASPDATVASGRFPIVLFSHGLPSLPETYAGVATRLAAAGFLVVAPTYPHTNSMSIMPNMIDVPRQPADAFYVIESVLGLEEHGDDPLAGHIDPTRYAAAGHSAGGFTTGGMLGTGHDARLAAAVIIAGGLLGPCATPAAEVLFVHGDADRTISYRDGRAAYNRIPWSKAFMTVDGGDHMGYLTPGQPGFDPMIKTMIDFLRATLYDDETARARMATDGSTNGTRFEQQTG